MQGKIDVALPRREAHTAGLAFKFLSKEPLICDTAYSPPPSPAQGSAAAGSRTREFHQHSASRARPPDRDR